MSTLGRIAEAQIYGSVFTGALPDEKNDRRSSLERERGETGISVKIGAMHAEEFYQKQIHHHQSDAVSLQQTFHAAVESMASNLQRIKELIKQIQKDFLSVESGSEIQGTLSALINDLKKTLRSEFNGKVFFTPQVIESIGGGFMFDLINGKIFFDSESFFDDNSKKDELIESIDVLIKKLNTWHLDSKDSKSASDTTRAFYEEIAAVPKMIELEGTKARVRKLSGNSDGSSLDVIKEFFDDVAEVSTTLDLKKIEEARELLKDSIRRIRDKKAKIIEVHNQVETDTAAGLLYS